MFCQRASLRAACYTTQVSSPTLLISHVEVPYIDPLDAQGIDPLDARPTLAAATCDLLCRHGHSAPGSLAWVDSSFCFEQLTPCTVTPKKKERSSAPPEFAEEGEESATVTEGRVKKVSPKSPNGAYLVEIDPSQGLAGVRLEATSMRPPGRGEIQIKTDWWALNFRPEP